MDVLLGLAGDYTSSENESDHYVTKVGGKPILPGSSHPTQANQVVCRACGAHLALVLQAYAPVNNSAERVLMLYGCVAPGCGKTSGAWRAIRCQLPLSPTTTADVPQQPVTATQSAAAHEPLKEQRAALEAFGGGFDDGGFGAADWGMEDNVTQLAGSEDNAFNFSDLDAALEASAAATKISAATAQHHHHHKPEQQPSTPTIPSCRPPCSSALTLPEFNIYASQEPQAKHALSQEEKEHIRQLLQAYEQNEIEGSGGGTGVSQSSAAVGKMASTDACSEESWAPEEYEEGKIRGVVEAYVKYSERLARSPEQCVRYCRGGEPLWPKAQLPSPSPCACCGSPRVFEMQLMAPVISLMMEAKDWMKQGAGEPGKDHDSDAASSHCQSESAPYGAAIADAAALNGAANWDICTVAAYTCVACCAPEPTDGDMVPVWVEEEVVVVNEDDCHTDMHMSYD